MGTMASMVTGTQSAGVIIPMKRGWLRFYRWVPFASRMDRYFLREMVLPFLCGVFFFIVVLTGHFLYQAINLIVNRGMPAKEILLMVLYLVPGAAALAIPIGMILATCVVINRLGREMELMALRASGISIQRVIMPFLITSIFVTFGDYFLNDWVAPVANHKANQIMHRLLRMNPTPLIESDKFFRVGEDFYFYVRQVDRATDTLHGVMIYRKDPQNWQFPQVVTARWARKDPRGDFWVLYDGIVHKYDRKGHLLAEVPFRRKTLNLKEDLEKFWAQTKKSFEMSSFELKERIEVFERGGLDAHTLKIDYHFKFSLPAATLVMTLWAAPLSLRFSRTGSFAGLFIAILGVFLYQGAMGWARAIGIRYHLPPFWVAWSQNFLFGLMGFWWLWRER